MKNGLAEKPNRANDPEMLDLTAFAKKMMVSTNTIRNWIKLGKLIEGQHYIHVGRVYRFPWSHDCLAHLMRSLAPEPVATRPRMVTRRQNHTQLVFRA
ncbi:hypothetical protein FO488_11800 [Geobacter sp. FeAm09]|uniref:hypothetical protein n=1 Tax=Geobacter sp. FeAm09 TaxID=2597769 RepID=UPI0011F05444|nr:hypothetical protein [Geobacter sp. FeAm09]QEM68772.1 hypothetical protein FO488_11800 [Geobacter sp. FeAm09]